MKIIYIILVFVKFKLYLSIDYYIEQTGIVLWMKSSLSVYKYLILYNWYISFNIVLKYLVQYINSIHSFPIKSWLICHTDNKVYINSNIQGLHSFE